MFWTIFFSTQPIWLVIFLSAITWMIEYMKLIFVCSACDYALIYHLLVFVYVFVTVLLLLLQLTTRVCYNSDLLSLTSHRDSTHPDMPLLICRGWRISRESYIALRSCLRGKKGNYCYIIMNWEFGLKMQVYSEHS